MDRKDWLALARTGALMLTLIGCAWWLHRSMEDNATWVLRDLEQLNR